jgi:MoxR-like ATPase
MTPRITTDALIADADTTIGELARVREELGRIVLGQEMVIEQTLTTLLAGGHGLLVGAPGLAKTRLMQALGTVLGLDNKRIQFTPDLMPGDILGSEILREDAERGRHFAFLQGPVFTQLLMADEINRASPRTQSALLQAMQENTVTIAGVPHALPHPFHVIATQNPIEQDGTYPLPEAQLDRFLMQIDIDYPDADDERAIIIQTTTGDDASARPVLDASRFIAIQKLVRDMPLPNDLLDVIVRTVRAARPSESGDARHLRWGAGPRAGQALSLAARARALLHGRFAPEFEDVIALAAPVLKHRIALDYSARAEGVTLDKIIGQSIAGITSH